jgi:hypothetical protein
MFLVRFSSYGMFIPVNRTRLHLDLPLNTYLQCSMFAALEEAMGTSSTQAVRMHDEIADDAGYTRAVHHFDPLRDRQHDARDT